MCWYSGRHSLRARPPKAGAWAPMDPEAVRKLRRRQSVLNLALKLSIHSYLSESSSVCGICPGGLNIGLRALKFEHKILDRIFKKMSPAIFLIRPSFRVISILETFTFWKILLKAKLSDLAQIWTADSQKVYLVSGQAAQKSWP